MKSPQPIVLCGDLHGQIDYGKLANSEVRRFLDGEYPPCIVISLGDWGVIWNDSEKSIKQERHLLDWYNEKPWETLVVLGNHEGFDRIGRLPIESRYGAPVRRVSEKVFILAHGNIYTIHNQRFFVFGGGESIDRMFRTPGASWWPEEIPNEADFRRGIQTLASVGGSIDWVLSHTCPRLVVDYMLEAGLLPSSGEKVNDPTVQMLSALEAQIQSVRGWYFGHFHLDFQWRYFHCLYRNLHRLPGRQSLTTVSRVGP